MADDAGAGDVDIGRWVAGANPEEDPVLPNSPMISSIPPLDVLGAVPLLAEGTPPPKISASRSVVAFAFELPS